MANTPEPKTTQPRTAQRITQAAYLKRAKSAAQRDGRKWTAALEKRVLAAR